MDVVEVALVEVAALTVLCLSLAVWLTAMVAMVAL
jgi:hypothetical protein